MTKGKGIGFVARQQVLEHANVRGRSSVEMLQNQRFWDKTVKEEIGYKNFMTLSRALADAEALQLSGNVHR